ncbi:RMD1 family protein [Parvicella tangerina]|nr:RMD1 family protein [Parvicella tangerina]
MKAIAYHLDTRPNMSNFHQLDGYTVLKRDRYFVLLEKEDNKTVYLKDYGSVVFLGWSGHEIKIFLKDKFSVSDMTKLKSEEFEVEQSGVADHRVNFDTIIVPNLTTEVIHIISLNLAQSVVLSHYQEMADDILSASSAVTAELKDQGRVPISRKELRKLLGRAIVLKNTVAENLYIFETPEFASSVEELAQIDTDLNENLDILNRFRSLQHNLSTVTDSLSFLMDILQHKHSSVLEWIIILLILIEVIQVLFEKLI